MGHLPDIQLKKMAHFFYNMYTIRHYLTASVATTLYG